MLGLYTNDSITVIENLKDFITVIFVIVDDIYQEVTPAYIKKSVYILKIKEIVFR